MGLSLPRGGLRKKEMFIRRSIGNKVMSRYF